MWCCCLPSVRPNVSAMFKSSASSFHLHSPPTHSPHLPPLFRFAISQTQTLLPHCFFLIHQSFCFSVAPMMEWTDNHYRTLARLITKHAWLYTEMIAAETLVHQQTNLVTLLIYLLFSSSSSSASFIFRISLQMSFCTLPQDRFLAFSPHQHPIVLQLGGSNVENLAKAAKLSHAYGYDEINLKFVHFLFPYAFAWTYKLIWLSFLEIAVDAPVLR